MGHLLSPSKALIDQDSLALIFIGGGNKSSEPGRLKNCLEAMIAGGTPSSSETQFWTDNNDPNGTPWVTISDMTRAFRISSTEKSVTEDGIRSARLTKLPKGTILYSIYASLGKTAILDTKAVTNQAIVGLVPDVTRVDKRYLTWWLKHAEPMVSLLSSSNTQSNLNAEKVANIPILFPPLPTQKAIANFLDRKTAAVDALIEKKEKLLKLLAEKRSALINQAVTKGLDPSVPMKDSGVTWIGEIPEHWGVKRLKNLAWIRGRIGFRGYTTNDQVDPGQGAAVIGATQIHSSGRLDFSVPVYLSWEKYYESPEIAVRKGDLLIVQRGSTSGKIGFVKELIEPTTINPSLILISSLGANPEYIAYFSMGKSSKSYLDSYLSSTAIPMLTQEQIGNIPIALPVPEEQGAIVAGLGLALERVDSLDSTIREQVKRLIEYRQSLITAAVTGQVEIPVEDYQ